MKPNSELIGLILRNINVIHHFFGENNAIEKGREEAQELIDVIDSQNKYELLMELADCIIVAARSDFSEITVFGRLLESDVASYVFNYYEKHKDIKGALEDVISGKYELCLHLLYSYALSKFPKQELIKAILYKTTRTTQRIHYGYYDYNIDLKKDRKNV
ncbi:MAG: hypothetical protein OMM_06923 [Candidatus Magnetoglobus multicellularis str. Araruama]|uniref:Uncharacterized protein n=1 Tax=Candidatus Magnetoglobus multicellularis str. Araruama TaxID=890399 RepID=A0A1V1PF81_9BACT|nr:MAG: hypothetical protein OMM_06923 [Candidatus Magnetoglobus multicellularis str. Araruama]